MTQGVEILAEGLSFPEGPVAMPDGSVILVELLAGRITRVWGRGRTEVVAVIGGGPNGAQLGPDGALYVCNCGGVDPSDPHCADPNAPGRIERVDLRTGRVERLYEQIEGRPLGSPNDLAIDAEGGIWFTDFGKVLKHAIGRGGIYYCKPDGSHIREVYYGGLGFNGIGLSPDGKMLYAANTYSGRLFRLTIAGPGLVTPTQGPRGTPLELVGAATGDADFDSLAVTAAGNICIGTLWTGGITTITPRGESSFMPLPEKMVTNIAFGGQDMRTAYVTFGLSGRLVKMRWSEPGLRLYVDR